MALRGRARHQEAARLPDRGDRRPSRPAGEAGLFDAPDDQPDDLRVCRIGEVDRTERSGPHRQITVVEERSQQVRVRAKDAAPRQSGCSRAAIPCVAGSSKLLDERRSDRGRLGVAGRRELTQRGHADLGIRVPRELTELGLGCRRRGAGEQVEAEAHVACVVRPKKRANGCVVLGDVDAVREERTTAHLVGERACVRPVHPDRDHRPDHRQHETEGDHRAGAQVEKVQHQQEDTGDTDRDGDSDAFDDRLHGETLLDGNDLVRGVDRRPGRAVGRRDVGDPEHAGKREEAVRGSTRPSDDNRHHG